MKLNLPRRAKRRLPARVREPLNAPPQADLQWSMDFMHDTLYHGKRFRTLNVIDEGVREALAIEVDTSLPAERVIRVLEQLKESRPLPHSSAEKISDKIFPAPFDYKGVVLERGLEPPRVSPLDP
jgi:putative transposase